MTFNINNQDYFNYSGFDQGNYYPNPDQNTTTELHGQNDSPYDFWQNQPELKDSEEVVPTLNKEYSQYNNMNNNSVDKQIDEKRGSLDLTTEETSKISTAPTNTDKTKKRKINTITPPSFCSFSRGGSNEIDEINKSQKSLKLIFAGKTILVNGRTMPVLEIQYPQIQQTNPDGSSYSGGMNDFNQYQGNGVLTTQDGIFDGFFFNGEKSFGKMTYINGDVYLYQW